MLTKSEEVGAWLHAHLPFFLQKHFYMYKTGWLMSKLGWWMLGASIHKKMQEDL